MFTAVWRHQAKYNRKKVHIWRKKKLFIAPLVCKWAVRQAVSVTQFCAEIYLFAIR